MHEAAENSAAFMLTFPAKMDKIITAVTKRAWCLAFREGGTVEASRRRYQAAVSEPPGDEPGVRRR